MAAAALSACLNLNVNERTASAGFASAAAAAGSANAAPREGEQHREHQENACEFHKSAGNLSSKIITTFVSLPSFGISTIVASWDEYVSTNDFVAVVARPSDLAAARLGAPVCGTGAGVRSDTRAWRR